MFCPDILARTLSVTSSGSGSYAHGNSWQYHSRSDRHSKVACWGVAFDLVYNCSLLQKHIADGKVFVGINHEMRDFRNNKRKNLDLVFCHAVSSQFSGSPRSSNRANADFASLVSRFQIQLSHAEAQALNSLPVLRIAEVSTTLLAIEAKAAMTAYQKALPRLKDELSSSFQTVLGDTSSAIAAGVVLVNTAETFISPGRNNFNISSIPPVVSEHVQPRDASRVISALRDIQRRSNTSDQGFDGLGVLLVDCQNDGSPVTVNSVHSNLVPPSDDFDYSRFIRRLSHIYSTRFANL